MSAESFDTSLMPLATDNGTFPTELPPGHSPLKSPTYLKAITISMYSIIIILAVGGNSIVCYIVFRARRMRTVMNFFIVSLALSDILMAIFCIPFTFLANLVFNYWPFGNILCPVVTYLQVVSVFLSSFTLVAISLDRYIAIIYPLRRKLTKKQAFIVIASIWVVSFLIPIPTAVTSRSQKYVNTSTAPAFCEEILWETEGAKLTYNGVLFFLQYINPLVILIVTYGRISYVMWAVKTPGEAMSSRDQRMSESKRKIIKMMITVVVIYAICWLPLNIINFVGAIDIRIYNIRGMNYIWMGSHWLAMSNCMYNPFIYCWMNAKFRNGFLRVFSCFTCGVIDCQDRLELERLRRQDTMLTSMNGNSGSSRRFNSSKRSSSNSKRSYCDYTAIKEKGIQ
ncbi:RYamide receptor-like [Mytilus californianus]|uniref:RYamide receptor-like n=1 Tax=Mytilus californianus TaxID=6549 RepID=UPI00224787C9|nr:RYamide receptor-like [Mytilus californianus]